MAIIDLSQPIHPGMPMFPGAPQPRLEPMASIDREGYAECWLGLASHTGTHIDAPAHLLPTAKALDDLPIEHFTGPGLIVPIRNPVVSLGDLVPFEARIRESRFVLLNTGWDAHWGDPSYFEDFPTLDPEAAAWLATFDLAGIGIDAPSLDPVACLSLPNHRAFLSRDICIIENLRGLDAIGPEPFLFSCLPLPIPKADGCPVRAVAMRLGS